MKNLMIIMISIVVFLLCEQAYAKPNPAVTMSVSSIDAIGSQDPKEIIAIIKIKNGSSKDICIMKDIIENRFSPFLEIHRRGRTERGVPFPPITSDIMKLGPGQELNIKRIVGYTGRGSDQKNARWMRISTIADWCGEGKKFVIKSQKFRTKF